MKNPKKDPGFLNQVPTLHLEAENHGAYKAQEFSASFAGYLGVR